VDRPVDPAAAEQAAVRGVDDRVRLRVGRDVAEVQGDAVCNQEAPSGFEPE